MRVVPLGVDGGTGLRECGGVAGRQHDVRPGRRQGPGRLATQPRRGAGDHAGLTTHTHRLPPSPMTPAACSTGLMTEVKSDSAPSVRSVCSQIRCTVSAISTGRPSDVASDRYSPTSLAINPVANP